MVYSPCNIFLWLSPVIHFLIGYGHIDAISNIGNILQSLAQAVNQMIRIVTMVGILTPQVAFHFHGDTDHTSTEIHEMLG